MKKIKVLQLPIVARRDGITHYAMRNWEFIDKTRFQFDFVTFSKSLDFEDELTKDGCKIHYVSCYAEENEEQFISELKTILSMGYDVIHLHTSYWKSFLVEEIAIEAGIPIIIVHSHNSMVCLSDPDLRQKAIERHEQQKTLFMPHHATHFLACSQPAANWLYGPQIPKEKIHILKNAIDTDEFAFNPKIRKEYREKFSLEDSFVIGHVGRFAYQKNHEMLIEIFEKVSMELPKAKLMLIGDGVRFDFIKEKVSSLGLEDRVLFLGRQSDTEVPKLMQAMDVFCNPSRFGGLDLTLVEAQTSGLKCLVTADIMPESKITENLQFLPLDVNAWCEAIIELSKGYTRTDCKDIVASAGYSLENQIHELEKIYSGQE
ncbi:MULTISPECIES: glycosyltransferase [unclassified Paenibacillus]|uniref:glycosyltransferase n=1 Tax=unclassified Paenibacillus TaxID=185978 RepID=UPI002405FF31|nr:MULTISPECIES: glycosyltransferase [unclassified Paenibacillus]MDF9843767.1 glycosyltransferase involved in cell wall biosynthesis [Paenibacillus sp. PastF-2]MDF9850394.1 glycosyltransferase involved in cell wall biosynthesis [Paenibacillus sp. PastM-2]MDF9856903.1 glycosyltransferase involved in cell wall biosynthesis [Paenibacillus sp. PastF-1]MDH6482240.1 glycosyltransferase involved in cell wall biosynthesis [Paenibacillus sp. PastH-2]MDH6509596.1 glycosyltransferase involved in cell wal